MAWKLFGKDVTQEQLPAELRSILAQMQRERSAFEQLTNSARDASQNLSSLTQPISDAQKLLIDLQARVKGLERVMPVLQTLDQQTEEVSRTQRRTETQLTQTSDDAKSLRGEIESLRTTLEAALALKNDLAGFIELGGGFKALRMDADKLSGELREVTEGFGRVRERQEELKRTSEAVATRLNTFEDRHTQANQSVAATESRAASLGQSLKELTEAANEAANTKRQLGTLKALADDVTQKVAILEQQRQTVERTASQVANLHELMKDVEQRTQKQEASAQTLLTIDTRVQELKGLHAEMQQQSAEISAQHDEAKRNDAELRTRLAGLKDEVTRAVKRFEGENAGLDAVSQRIVDMRSSLTDMELRFKTLEESSRSISDVKMKADGLAAQLSGITESVSELETQAERIRAVEASAGRLDSTVEDMTQRVSRLEKSKPAVDAAIQDLGSLKGSHETVRAAIEQVQQAQAEVARVHASQSETKLWLKSTTDSVAALRGELAVVEEMKPMVEKVRGEADRVTQSMGQIESRGKLIEDMNSRLASLASLSGQIEERTSGLLARMNGADERFLALAAHSEEAARIEKLVPEAMTTVAGAERRVAEVDASLASLEARARDIEALAERTRVLGQELEQRQAALDKASEHLERASELREQAAHSAHELEAKAGQLAGSLTTAGGRISELNATLDQLDGRAGNLRFAQKRMAQFEERLAKWEALETQLNRSLEHMTQRRATLDALEADMHRLFEVSEKTVDDVRSIAAAKEEVTQTRATLENVLGLVTHVHDAANDLSHRKRQVDQAEERLGRVEALLADIQKGLEALKGQKALMDQVTEQAGSLAFHTKQAEVLIATLREERETGEKVRAAVAEVRDVREGPNQGRKKTA